MKIGAHVLRNAVLAAPMAGVTDRAFRRLARRYGAGLAVSEMVSARPELRSTRKSRLRIDHRGEEGPISVQIAGSDPALLADAARYNVAHGAQIIDINMGCPAKKVCNVAAGSALLQDEPLVARILDAVVRAVDIPVTLKIRTGPHPAQRNALRVARIAEAAGIRMLAIHGRTRACLFGGEAEYATIAQVKREVRIPVIANGDIRTPQDARRVLELTGADGVMVGRAAQGRPWLFGQIVRHLESGDIQPPPPMAEMGAVLLEQMEELYELYGREQGARIARKHIGWAVCGLPGGETLRQATNALLDAGAQAAAVRRYFGQLAANEDPMERLAA